MTLSTLNQDAGAVAPSFAERFASRTETLGVSQETIARAWDEISSGRRVFLVVSGKMGAGKDTIAPEVFKAMGRGNGYHLYYADALKGEADRIFTVIRANQTAEQAAVAVADAFAMTADQADSLVQCVWDELAFDDSLHARSRTSGIRRFLQLLGTDVRRAQDPDYWVNIGLREAIEQLADGRDVFATDARFPNEVEGAGDIGAFTVRLEVSEETQKRRLLERDGALPSADTFAHPSETSLDGFSGYSLTLDNNSSVPSAVHAVVMAWMDQREAR